MEFKAKIHVRLKPTVNDPQGLAIMASLKNLGFQSAVSVRMGKFLEIGLESDTLESATAQIEEMGKLLFANPVIEEFDYHIEEANV